MIDRRQLLKRVAAGGAAAFLTAGAGSENARSREIWTFDSLRRIGGMSPGVEGSPTLVRSPFGRALQFDGLHDALFFERHPLAGASRFTFEALFRPDGGAFEQRWFHLESEEAGVSPGRGSTRMLFEIRVIQESWYLDAFVKGPGYSQALMVSEKRFPLGRWYHVAQTFDGQTYRSYVDGQLQAQALVPFRPQGPGRSSVGIRLNRVNPFRGAVRAAAFTRDMALHPAAFLLAPA
ncbi:MAG: LamG-like jellyroll fold domain-containing protein [Sphingomicrobium sp.]